MPEVYVKYTEPESGVDGAQAGNVVAETDPVTGGISALLANGETLANFVDVPGETNAASVEV